MTCRADNGTEAAVILDGSETYAHGPRFESRVRTRLTVILIIVLITVALAGCTTDRTRRGYLRENAARFDAPPARPVIVVPGFGVSRLFDPVTGRFVWGTAHAMVQRRYADDLDLQHGDRLVPRGFVGSRGPINIAWQLTEALRKYGGYTPSPNPLPRVRGRGQGEGAHRDLYAFAYDWRRSARDNAQELAKFVDGVRRAHGGAKVDIVTHSAGALVGLAYVKLIAPDAVEHLVLVAPTQRGVADAFRLLTRGEHFLRRSFTIEMAATWPSTYELLPEKGRFLIDEQGHEVAFDAWDAASWPFPIDGEALARARRFRDELRDAPLPANVRLTVIAGDCVPTARRVLARSDRTYAFYRDELREDERALAAMLFEPGDGTVPISSATGGGEALLFCDGHQGIASDPNVHRALIRLLRADTLPR
jgi:pimeloyl-ACP methyl ester carboxylesterase